MKRNDPISTNKFCAKHCIHGVVKKVTLTEGPFKGFYGDVVDCWNNIHLNRGPKEGCHRQGVLPQPAKDEKR